jgi:poly-gamma-glutamate synthesis protein (capsule biosynthesis protein)
MHWGDEYVLKQNTTQEQLTDWLIANGVDHIIGNHPHVIQPTELRKDKYNGGHHFIAYSLGNYISNMSARNTDIGLSATLRFSKLSFSTFLTDITTDSIRTDRNGFILRPLKQK